MIRYEDEWILCNKGKTLMHMADALLTPAVGGVMYAASAGAMAFSVKKIKSAELGENKIPLMAVTGAMVFAAQMINFTIPGTGSSGHLSGGILLAALLGPFAGFLTMSAVLIIQCLIFADGGLLALGANIFNIGVIPCLFVFLLVTKPLFTASPTTAKIWSGSVVSSVIALQLGAFAIVMQTTISGIAELPFSVFILLMQPIHLVIGVVEGLVTAAILSFVLAARPQLLITGSENSAIAGKKPESVSKAKLPGTKIIIIFACVAVVLIVVFARFSSAYPDGLEWSVINASGAGDITSGHDTGSEKTADAPITGLIGAASVFALAGAAALIIRLFKKKKKNFVE